MVSPKNYFDHDADIGIIGYGHSLEESFIDAAKAMFALMTDLSQLNSKIKVSFQFEESDIELAFVTWLNFLIAKAQAKNLVFSQFQINRKGDLWQSEASGEVWRDDLERRVDVKGATLTMLSVKEINNEWIAKCIVDV